MGCESACGVCGKPGDIRDGEIMINEPTVDETEDSIFVMREMAGVRIQIA
jgi:hypothetical protein